jgi:predicted HTH transcriptional regulator
LNQLKKAKGNEALYQLSDVELIGLEWIKTQGTVSTKDYAIHFDITQQTASRHLSHMFKLDLLLTNGENIKSPKLKYSAKT